MLTKSDLYFNFQAFAFLSKYNLLPIVFDVETGTMTPRQKVHGRNKRVLDRRMWLWRTQIGLLALTMAYKGLSLVQSLMNLRATAVHSLCSNIMIVAFSVLVLQELHLLCFHGPDNCFLMTQLHCHKPAASIKKKGAKKRWLEVFRTLWKNHSVQEMIIVTFPFSIVNCIVGSILLLVADSRGLYLLHSLLPQHHQNPLTFCLFLVLESLALIQMFSAAYICTYETLSLLPHFTTDILEPLEDKIKWACDSTQLHQLSQGLVKAELEVKMFNAVYRGFNYICKLALLFLSISAIFAGIRFSVILILHCTYTFAMLSIGIYAIIMYISLFGQMFVIPETMDSLRRRVGMRARLFLFPSKGIPTAESGRTLEEWKCRCVDKRLQAIPYCGIRAGSFYTLDRMSTPTFLLYVVTQVCSLMITVK